MAEKTPAAPAVKKDTVTIKPFNCVIKYKKVRYENNKPFECDAKTAAQLMKDGHAVLATAPDAPPTAVDAGPAENDGKDGKDSK